MFERQAERMCELTPTHWLTPQTLARAGLLQPGARTAVQVSTWSTGAQSLQSSPPVPLPPRRQSWVLNPGTHMWNVGILTSVLAKCPPWMSCSGVGL